MGFYYREVYVDRCMCEGSSPLSSLFARPTKCPFPLRRIERQIPPLPLRLNVCAYRATGKWPTGRAFEIVSLPIATINVLCLLLLRENPAQRL